MLMVNMLHGLRAAFSLAVLWRSCGSADPPEASRQPLHCIGRAAWGLCLAARMPHQNALKGQYAQALLEGHIHSSKEEEWS